MPSGPILRLHEYAMFITFNAFILTLVVGVFIVVVTPARLAQYSYDKARILASTRFGWLVLAGVMGELIEIQNYYPRHSLSVTQFAFHFRL
jgi:hypothetical protein